MSHLIAGEFQPLFLIPFVCFHTFICFSVRKITLEDCIWQTSGNHVSQNRIKSSQSVRKDFDVYMIAFRCPRLSVHAEIHLQFGNIYFLKYTMTEHSYSFLCLKGQQEDVSDMYTLVDS